MWACLYSIQGCCDGSKWHLPSDLLVHRGGTCFTLLLMLNYFVVFLFSLVLLSVVVNYFPPELSRHLVVRKGYLLRFV